MSNFRQYKRKERAELRTVTEIDIEQYLLYEALYTIPVNGEYLKVSISEQDIKNGSPKIGDMIARNPKNHLDQWLVAEQYFKDNFEI